MTHTALARKYRPTSFSDLVSQDHVAAGLAGAVAKGRVAHAYVLTGPRGVGKTSAARILAMALNCEDRASAPAEGEPCGKCESCLRIWSGVVNLDVVEIDAASNRGVDDARELRERAMYAASGPDRHKVYIVDEAHMLTREAWNALLKILEEPPPRVVFVFATTEPHKISNTAAPVMSRVQRFDFRRLGPQAIMTRLRYVADQEAIVAEEEALQLITRVADGGMRDALSLLDQSLAFGEGPVSAERVRHALGLIDEEMYGELLDIIAGRRTAEVFPFVGRLVEGGADLAEFLNGAGEVLRALLIRILDGRPEGLTDGLRAAVEQHAAHYQSGDILRMLKLLGGAEAVVRRSPNARLHVETLLVQWSLLDRTVELNDVLAALAAHGESRTGELTRGPAGKAMSELDAHDCTGGDSPAPVVADGPSLSIEAIGALWRRITEVAGQRRRMVQEALGHARAVEVRDGVVVLEVTDSEVHLEGLTRSRDVIQKVIAEVMGCGPVRIEYRSRSDAAPAGNDTPLRLNQEQERQERMRRYRDQDPALDAIADALDLEVIE
ncbi:MAG: DNA polymerase III subunit gamma/tau [Gemmatimonadota bacterium]|nr:MAG: DNA polymerase III subunit gamma/tau [Gemmatimonadota bacterium]